MGLIRRISNAITASISTLFLGLMLILASPIILVTTLIRVERKKIPLKDFLDGINQGIKEQRKSTEDPDNEEDWKKQHREEFGEDT